MKRNYLLLLFLLLLIPINAKAVPKMSIACNLVNADQNSAFTCEVIASDDEASGGEGRIIVDNGIVKSIEKRHCAIGDVSVDGFYCADEVALGTIPLVSFEVEKTSTGITTIAIENASVVGKDFQTTSVSVAPVLIATKAYDITLDNQNATTPGSNGVYAYFNNPMPTITVPKKIYTLTYNYNGNGQSNTTATSTFNFGGYYTETNGAGTKYINENGTSAKNYDLKDKKTLYAKWTGGSVTLPNPTREGYVFTGWFNASTNGTKIGNALSEYTPSANKTLYAQWKEILKSDNYEVKKKKIFAKPVDKEYKQSELESKVETANNMEIYDKNNNKVNNNALVGTGYKIKTSNVYYDVIVLGDITGDGKISLGDISAIYNHYKGNKILNGVYLEAGLLTGNDRVMIGDVSKLYNFYRGNSSL